MALKNLGFLKNLKSPNLGFLENKNLMSDLSFELFFTYYATNLIEMLSNFPINMNCIFLRSHGRIFESSSCGTV